MDFDKMYPHLGDEHNLAVIRKLNPGPPDKSIHCKKIFSGSGVKIKVKNANACNHIPLGGGKFGICPNNPYHPSNAAKREEKIAELKQIAVSEEADRLFESMSLEITSLFELGLIRDASALTTSEFLLGLHAVREQKRKEREEQAVYIIQKLAEAWNKK